MGPSLPLIATTKYPIPMNQPHKALGQPLCPPRARQFPSNRIEEALGIRTYDHVTTSYQTGPYTVWYLHGPFTDFKTVGSLIILDTPEICLTLSSTSNPKQRAHSYINNIRQVVYSTKRRTLCLQRTNPTTYTANAPRNHRDARNRL